MTTTDIAARVRENRLRRMADRYGLRLTKSRRRDPKALDYGLYALFDIRTNFTVNQLLLGRYAHGWTLDDVENYLTEGERR